MTFSHIRFISFKQMRPDGRQAGILWGNQRFVWQNDTNTNMEKTILSSPNYSLAWPLVTISRDLPTSQTQNRHNRSFDLRERWVPVCRNPQEKKTGSSSRFPLPLPLLFPSPFPLAWQHPHEQGSKPLWPSFFTDWFRRMFVMAQFLFNWQIQILYMQHIT